MRILNNFVLSFQQYLDEEKITVNKKMVFVRYGGLSSVKQAAYDPTMPSFHLPPVKRGIYAFPLQFIEPFLLGSTEFKSHRMEWIKDKKGNIITSDHPDYEKVQIVGDDPKDPGIKQYRYFTAHLPGQKNVDPVDKKWGLAKHKTPVKFNYSGEIWHHLDEHLPPSDILLKKGGWILTDMPTYVKCLKRAEGEYHFSQKSTEFRQYAPDLDHFEVFIEKV